MRAVAIAPVGGFFGDTAPDNVLRGTALENHRVEHDIQENSPQRKCRGEPVGEGPEPGDGCDAERPREDERLPIGQLARDQGGP